MAQEFDTTQFEGMTDAQLVATHRRYRDFILAGDAQVEMARAINKHIEYVIMGRMASTEVEAFTIGETKVTRKSNTVAAVAGERWVPFYNYIFDEAMKLRATGQENLGPAFAVMQKRVINKTLIEIYDTTKVAPPGVELSTFPSLTISHK